MCTIPCFQQPYIICVIYFSGKSETKEHLICCKTGKLRDLQGLRSGNFWKVQFLAYFARIPANLAVEIFTAKDAKKMTNLKPFTV